MHLTKSKCKNNHIIPDVVDTLLRKSNMCLGSAYLNKKSDEKSNLKCIRENTSIEIPKAHAPKTIFHLRNGFDLVLINVMVIFDL